MRKTVKNLLAEYGAVAVVVYFAFFFAVLFGFWGAIRMGWHPASVTGSVGAFTAAYIATKVTQPLRIMATLALTPLAARGYEGLLGAMGRQRRDASDKMRDASEPRDGTRG